MLIDFKCKKCGPSFIIEKKELEKTLGTISEIFDVSNTDDILITYEELKIIDHGICTFSCGKCGKNIKNIKSVHQLLKYLKENDMLDE